MVDGRGDLQRAGIIRIRMCDYDPFLTPHYSPFYPSPYFFAYPFPEYRVIPGGVAYTLKSIAIKHEAASSGKK